MDLRKSLVIVALLVFVGQAAAYWCANDASCQSYELGDKLEYNQLQYVNLNPGRPLCFSNGINAYFTMPLYPRRAYGYGRGDGDDDDNNNDGDDDDRHLKPLNIKSLVFKRTCGHWDCGGMNKTGLGCGGFEVFMGEACNKTAIALIPSWERGVVGDAYHVEAVGSENAQDYTVKSYNYTDNSVTWSFRDHRVNPLLPGHQYYIGAFKRPLDANDTTCICGNLYATFHEEKNKVLQCNDKDCHGWCLPGSATESEDQCVCNAGYLNPPQCDKQADNGCSWSNYSADNCAVFSNSIGNREWSAEPCKLDEWSECRGDNSAYINFGQMNSTSSDFEWDGLPADPTRDNLRNKGNIQCHSSCTTSYCKIRVDAGNNRILAGVISQRNNNTYVALSQDSQCDNVITVDFNQNIMKYVYLYRLERVAVRKINFATNTCPFAGNTFVGYGYSNDIQGLMMYVKDRKMGLNMGGIKFNGNVGCFTQSNVTYAAVTVPGGLLYRWEFVVIFAYEFNNNLGTLKMWTDGPNRENLPVAGPSTDTYWDLKVNNDVCASSVCQFGGTCMLQTDNFNGPSVSPPMCSCPAGTGGAFCDQDVRSEKKCDQQVTSEYSQCDAFFNKEVTLGASRLMQIAPNCSPRDFRCPVTTAVCCSTRFANFLNMDTSPFKNNGGSSPKPDATYEQAQCGLNGTRGWVVPPGAEFVFDYDKVNDGNGLTACNGTTLSIQYRMCGSTPETFVVYSYNAVKQSVSFLASLTFQAGSGLINLDLSNLNRTRPYLIFVSPSTATSSIAITGIKFDGPTVSAAEQQDCDADVRSSENSFTSDFARSIITCKPSGGSKNGNLAVQCNGVLPGFAESAIDFIMTCNRTKSDNERNEYNVTILAGQRYMGYMEVKNKTEAWENRTKFSAQLYLNPNEGDCATPKWEFTGTGSSAGNTLVPRNSFFYDMEQTFPEPPTISGSCPFGNFSWFGVAYNKDMRNETVAIYCQDYGMGADNNCTVVHATGFGRYQNFHGFINCTAQNGNTLVQFTLTNFFKNTTVRLLVVQNGDQRLAYTRGDVGEAYPLYPVAATKANFDLGFEVWDMKVCTDCTCGACLGLGSVCRNDTSSNDGLKCQCAANRRGRYCENIVPACALTVSNSVPCPHTAYPELLSCNADPANLDRSCINGDNLRALRRIWEFSPTLTNGLLSGSYAGEGFENATCELDQQTVNYTSYKMMLHMKSGGVRRVFWVTHKNLDRQRIPRYYYASAITGVDACVDPTPVYDANTQTASYRIATHYQIHTPVCRTGTYPDNVPAELDCCYQGYSQDNGRTHLEFKKKEMILTFAGISPKYQRTYRGEATFKQDQTNTNRWYIAVNLTSPVSYQGMVVHGVLKYFGENNTQGIRPHTIRIVWWGVPAGCNLPSFSELDTRGPALEGTKMELAMLCKRVDTGVDWDGEQNNDETGVDVGGNFSIGAPTRRIIFNTSFQFPDNHTRPICQNFLYNEDQGDWWGGSDCIQADSQGRACASYREAGAILAYPIETKHMRINVTFKYQVGGSVVVAAGGSIQWQDNPQCNDTKRDLNTLAVTASNGNQFYYICGNPITKSGSYSAYSDSDCNDGEPTPTLIQSPKALREDNWYNISFFFNENGVFGANISDGQLGGNFASFECQGSKPTYRTVYLGLHGNSFPSNARTYIDDFSISTVDNNTECLQTLWGKSCPAWMMNKRFKLDNYTDRDNGGTEFGGLLKFKQCSSSPNGLCANFTANNIGDISGQELQVGCNDLGDYVEVDFFKGGPKFVYRGAIRKTTVPSGTDIEFGFDPSRGCLRPSPVKNDLPLCYFESWGFKPNPFGSGPQLFKGSEVCRSSGFSSSSCPTQSSLLINTTDCRTQEQNNGQWRRCILGFNATQRVLNYSRYDDEDGWEHYVLNYTCMTKNGVLYLQVGEEDGPIEVHLSAQATSVAGVNEWGISQPNTCNLPDGDARNQVWITNASPQIDQCGHWTCPSNSVVRKFNFSDDCANALSSFNTTFSPDSPACVSEGLAFIKEAPLVLKEKFTTAEIVIAKLVFKVQNDFTSANLAAANGDAGALVATCPDNPANILLMGLYHDRTPWNNMAYGVMSHRLIEEQLRITPNITKYMQERNWPATCPVPRHATSAGACKDVINRIRGGVTGDHFGIALGQWVECTAVLTKGASQAMVCKQIGGSGRSFSVLRRLKSFWGNELQLALFGGYSADQSENNNFKNETQIDAWQQALAGGVLDQNAPALIFKSAEFTLLSGGLTCNSASSCRSTGRGNCTDVAGGFTCSCKSPFFGDRCQFGAVCNDGSYYNQTQNLCAPCGSGTFGQNGTCIACSLGRFSPALGAKTCDLCPPGMYQNMTGQRNCIAVPVGTYASEFGTPRPIPCPRGRFSSVMGNNDCEKCPEGNSTDQTTSGGQFVSLVNGVRDRCARCPVGQYSDANTDGCARCKAGFYQNSTGSKSCAPCPIGTSTLGLSGSDDSSDCVACDRGFAAPTTGTSKCQQCGKNKYSSPDLTSCEDCPAGAESPAGSGSITDCSLPPAAPSQLDDITLKNITDGCLFLTWDLPGSNGTSPIAKYVLVWFQGTPNGIIGSTIFAALILPSGLPAEVCLPATFFGQAVTFYYTAENRQGLSSVKSDYFTYTVPVEGPKLVSVVAADGSQSPGMQAGDTITFTFSEATNANLNTVYNHTEVQALIGGDFGVAVQGQWTTSTTFVVTVVTPSSTVKVGQTFYYMMPGNGIKNAAGTSTDAQGAGTLRGTFGVASQLFSLSVSSTLEDTSATFSMTPANDATATANYDFTCQISATAAPSFGGSGSGVSFTTSGTPSAIQASLAQLTVNPSPNWSSKNGIRLSCTMTSQQNTQTTNTIHESIPVLPVNDPIVINSVNQACNVTINTAQHVNLLQLADVDTANTSCCSNHVEIICVANSGLLGLNADPPTGCVASPARGSTRGRALKLQGPIDAVNTVLANMVTVQITRSTRITCLASDVQPGPLNQANQVGNGAFSVTDALGFQGYTYINTSTLAVTTLECTPVCAGSTLTASARLLTDLTGVNITFNTDIQSASLDIFDTATKAMFGPNAFCFPAGASVICYFSSSQQTVSLGVILRIRQNVIKICGDTPVHDAINVTVLPPLTTPGMSCSLSKTYFEIDKCATGGVLTIRPNCFGSGSFPANFQWSLAGQVSTDAILSQDYNSFTAGNTYTGTLSVSNLVGDTFSTVFTVVVLNNANNLEITGRFIHTNIIHSQFMVFQFGVTRSCGTVDFSQLVWTWTCSHNLTGSNAFLVKKANNMGPGQTATCSVYVTLNGTQVTSPTVTVTITTRSAPVFAYIDLGHGATFRENDPINASSAQSIDGNCLLGSSCTPLDFTWRCADTTGQACKDQSGLAITIPSQADIYFPANTFSTGVYILQVEAKRSSDLVADTATTFLNIEPPSQTLPPLVDLKCSNNQKKVGARARIICGCTASRVSGTPTYSLTVSSSAIPTRTNGQFMFVNPEGLAVLTMSEFDAKCSVTAGGLTGSQTVTIETRPKPCCGQLSASPLNVTAFSDDLTLEATGWQLGTAGSTPIFKFFCGSTPLTGESNTNSFVKTANFPEGTGAQNTLECGVLVCDPEDPRSCGEARINITSMPGCDATCLQNLVNQADSKPTQDALPLLNAAMNSNGGSAADKEALAKNALSKAKDLLDRDNLEVVADVDVLVDTVKTAVQAIISTTSDAGDSTRSTFNSLIGKMATALKNNGDDQRDLLDNIVSSIVNMLENLVNNIQTSSVTMVGDDRYRIASTAQSATQVNSLYDSLVNTIQASSASMLSAEGDEYSFTQTGFAVTLERQKAQSGHTIATSGGGFSTTTTFQAAGFTAAGSTLIDAAVVHATPNPYKDINPPGNLVSSAAVSVYAHDVTNPNTPTTATWTAGQVSIVFEAQCAPGRGYSCDFKCFRWDGTSSWVSTGVTEASPVSDSNSAGNSFLTCLPSAAGTYAVFDTRPLTGSANQDDGSKSDNTPIIAGGAAGGLLVLVIGFLLWRRSAKKRAEKTQRHVRGMSAAPKPVQMQQVRREGEGGEGEGVFVPQQTGETA